MDLLSHVLQQAGLVRRILDVRDIDTRGALQFPCERSMGLHVVTRGELWIHAPSLTKPLVLTAGDIALMARGCVHVVSTSAELTSHAIHRVAAPAAVLEPSSDATGSRLISGAYQLWHDPRHPLFDQLPSWFVVPASDLLNDSPLAQAVRLMRPELDEPRIGSQGVKHGLLDVVFTYVLRELVARETSGAGMSLVLQDAPVLEAVTLLHQEYAHAWTLDELATRVGLSRTSFAERFRAAAGDSPLRYLRTIRMQQAVRLLGETRQSLESVAAAVGYADAFSFSKVFKRTTGLSPRDFRRRDAAERELPYRFQFG